MNTDNKVKAVLETYMVEERHAQVETDPVREWVERGLGVTISRTKFLRMLEIRARQQGRFQHARGSNKSSPFGTFYGLRLRTPMVRPLLSLYKLQSLFRPEELFCLDTSGRPLAMNGILRAGLGRKPEVFGSFFVFFIYRWEISMNLKVMLSTCV